MHAKRDSKNERMHTLNMDKDWSMQSMMIILKGILIVN